MSPCTEGQAAGAAREEAKRLLAPTGLTVDQLLAAEGFPDDSRAVVYLSGSIVSGHANPWSDIDVFAVADRGPSGAVHGIATTNAVAPHFLGDRRVDYEFWRPAAVEELARRLDAYDLASGTSIQGATFLRIEEIFIHRLRIGVPLLDEAGFARLQARFDFDRFAAFQTEDAIRHLDAELEDLVGMRKGGDRDGALWVARQVLDVSVEAYLHSLGNTDPVEKWRVRYLQELPDSARHRQLQADYWRLQYPAAAVALRDDGDVWHRYVEEVIAFSNRVAAWAQG
ncbi:MAG TPA: nucleotidyltransferase domain-containing protein [Acidimicrobiales bacterium]|nr:nucleotidyltransferase domain-containing protein [Acidimicrobiales bacterium]